MTGNDRRVAIIGAGPAGLVAARFLQGQGFAPVLFDANSRVGGQWDVGAPASAVWPGMRTNTSRLMTRFSDLEFPAGTPTFPRNDQIRDYLRRYAERFGLLFAARLGSRVERIARHPSGGYVVQTKDAHEVLPRLVVATGRFNHPYAAPIDGLDSFSGTVGVTHSFRYAAARGRLAGTKVLVAGGSISALEIVSDLERLGAEVTVAMRRQRYVAPRLVGSVPVDTFGFTRAGALAGEAFPPEETAAELKAFLLATGGNPAAFGAPAPAENILEAGITLSQDYLTLLAEGRIEVKPWIARVDGRTVHFRDGTAAAFDGIVAATGYTLSLPFLDAEIARILDLDERHIDLADFTFHPALPGFACIGLYPVIGPTFPALELQARYLAYAWGGAVPAPSQAQLAERIAAYRRGRGGRQSQLMHGLALRLARLAGVEPDPAQTPDLARALLFGPLTATSFRLHGPDALAGANATIAEEAACYGTISDPRYTPSEHAQLTRLAAVSDDAGLARLAGG